MSDSIHGFVLTKQKEIAELDGVLYCYTHEKTGLRLVWLKREEENKTFAIAFETLPENDTGVFHILEHSTLCGSEKYPVKEPFLQLMKSSMNTFLNAMTYPDKTVYPVSSKNSKDFMNLVSVYLDAVFKPAIYKKPEIFRQEGWHYEIDEDGSVCYNGVVFNEMKGVYSDPDELAATAVMKALYPDTPYGFSSGGDPAKIPDLTYDEFIDTHARFYSPSNAYVLLDGSVDIDAVMKLIDEEYLSKASVGKHLDPPKMQSPVNPGIVDAEFEVASEEEEQTDSRVILAGVISKKTDREKIAAMSILSDVLCGGNHALLTKAILESGIAEDVSLTIEEDIIQPFFKLEMRNVERDNIENAYNLLTDTLKKILADGIDKTALNAAIANAEFKARERDFDGYPQGLMLCIGMADSMIYGEEPEYDLEVGNLYDVLRQKAKLGYFEELLDKVIINNTHSCVVRLLPSVEFGEKRNESEMNRIAAELENFSEEDVQAIYDEQDALLSWQMSEDSPEALATMPTLSLDDVDATPEDIPTRQYDKNGVHFLEHSVSNNGVAYFSLFFDINGFSEKEYSELSLMCELLGKLDTDKYSSSDLANVIRENLGSLEFSVTAFSGENETDTCKARLSVCFSTLKQNAENALKLVLHIIKHTDFSDADAISDIIRQAKIDLYQEISMSGSSAALVRLMAQNTVAGVIKERADGIAYYEYLDTLENITDFSFLATLNRNVFVKTNLVVSITGDIPELSRDELFTLDELKENRTAVITPWKKCNEGFVVPSDIAFAARGGNIKSCGGVFSGKMSLAAHILSLDYLWNIIRVQGGAYGTGLTVKENGFVGCYSYRDPTAAESLEVFADCAEYLKESIDDDTDLTGDIIGTIADGSPLLSVRNKGVKADTLYFNGITYEKLCERRRLLLETIPSDLLKIADTLHKTLSENSCVCVIGSKEQIEACKDIDKVVVL
jgi:presequence protease